MEIIQIILQVLVGLGILNVWLIRRNQDSDFRGKGATNMVEEFEAYGLPKQAVWVVGALKILFALGLLAGIFLPQLVLPSAVGLGLLMVGALAMHVKVGDPIKRSIPALSLLVACVAIALL